MKQLVKTFVLVAMVAAAQLVSNKASAQQQFVPTMAWFQEFAAKNNYVLYQAPANYEPTQRGIWDYSAVFLLDQGINEIQEVYVFDNPNSYYMAEGKDKDYWEDAGTHTMHCSGAGSLCGGEPVPCIAVSAGATSY